MPYKHQSDCYRTFGGLRWSNFCDVLDDRIADNVEHLKARGIRFKFRKHPDGYRQAFIHPDDLELVFSPTFQKFC